MQRRSALVLFGHALAATIAPAGAATVRKAARIGVLCASWDDLSHLLRALDAAGYPEGPSARFIVKRGDDPPGLDRQAQALVAARIDVIVCFSMAETQAARRATSTIPIVMVYGLAPVELGLIASLARPGGNVTGTVAYPLELVAKSVQVFHEALPRLQQLAVLVDADPWAPIFLRETQRAAAALGIPTQAISITSPAELQLAFAQLKRERPDGIAVCHSLQVHMGEIIEFAAKNKLPALYPFVPAVRQGGLIALAPSLLLVYARAASIIDRMLRGARPEDTPVEQPTQFVLAVNRKAASALGLKLPQSILLRARFFD